MEAEAHPDLFGEATRHGLQRVTQVASCAGTAAQVYVAHQRTQARAVAEKDDRARRALQAQVRAERQAARAAWMPALDPRWLAAAGLPDVAATWSAAVPYADRNVPWYDTSAATAMRKAEERLRDLHPYAMTHYDRLRGTGLSPTDAMAQAAPLFARHPAPHDPPYIPRQGLDAGTGLTWTATAPAAEAGPGEDADLAGMEQRGARIAAALQARARAEGREPLGTDELRTVLETVTNLPADTIGRLAGRPSAGRATDLVPVAAGARRTARPWELDFPVPVREVVAITAGTAPGSGVRPAIQSRSAGRAMRPGGPGYAG
ncbi:MAG TPA: hypothetical protein VGG25_16720 [Streptosporangiaceae bacterium]|jgi:hypothetical protein